MWSVQVGDEVMENIASPTPGMDSMAHWPRHVLEAHARARVRAHDRRKS